MSFDFLFATQKLVGYADGNQFQQQLDPYSGEGPGCPGGGKGVASHPAAEEGRRPVGKGFFPLLPLTSSSFSPTEKFLGADFDKFSGSGQSSLGGFQGTLPQTDHTLVVAKDPTPAPPVSSCETCFGFSDSNWDCRVVNMAAGVCNLDKFVEIDRSGQVADLKVESENCKSVPDFLVDACQLQTVSMAGGVIDENLDFHQEIVVDLGMDGAALSGASGANLSSNYMAVTCHSLDDPSLSGQLLATAKGNCQIDLELGSLGEDCKLASNGPKFSVCLEADRELQVAGTQSGQVVAKAPKICQVGSDFDSLGPDHMVHKNSPKSVQYDLALVGENFGNGAEYLQRCEVFLQEIGVVSLNDADCLAGPKSPQNGANGSGGGARLPCKTGCGEGRNAISLGQEEAPSGPPIFMGEGGALSCPPKALEGKVLACPPAVFVEAFAIRNGFYYDRAPLTSQLLRKKMGKGKGKGMTDEAPPPKSEFEQRAVRRMEERRRAEGDEPRPAFHVERRPAAEGRCAPFALCGGGPAHFVLPCPPPLWTDEARVCMIEGGGDPVEEDPAQPGGGMLTVQPVGALGVPGNPRQAPQFQWEGFDLQIQALYQAFLARKATFDMGRVVVPKVADLLQHAQAQQDQILVLQNVAHQQGQILEFVWEQMGSLMMENAQMAQNLMPLQGFANFVREEFRIFFEEGTKTAQGAASLAATVAGHDGAIAALRDETRALEVENARLRADMLTLHQQGVRSHAEIEELRSGFAKFAAEKGQSLPIEQVQQMGACLQRAVEIVPKIEPLQKLAAENNVLIDHVSERLSNLETALPQLASSVDQLWQGNVADGQIVARMGSLEDGLKNLRAIVACVQERPPNPAIPFASAPSATARTTGSANEPQVPRGDEAQKGVVGNTFSDKDGGRTTTPDQPRGGDGPSSSNPVLTVGGDCSTHPALVLEGGGMTPSAPMMGWPWGGMVPDAPKRLTQGGGSVPVAPAVGLLAGGGPVPNVQGVQVPAQGGGVVPPPVTVAQGHATVGEVAPSPITLMEKVAPPESVQADQAAQPLAPGKERVVVAERQGGGPPNPAHEGGDEVSALKAQLQQLQKQFGELFVSHKAGRASVDQLAPMIAPSSVPSSSPPTTDRRAPPMLRLEGEGDRTFFGACAPPFNIGGPSAGYYPGTHAQPTGMMHGPGAQINVLGAQAPALLCMPGGLGPDIWSDMVKPQFSGQPGDYARFERDWERAERKYRQNSPLGCSDNHLLEYFVLCLDEATRRRLQLQREQRPHMTLVDVKRELRAEFGVDIMRRNHEEWQTLTLPLNGPAGFELTYPDWRNFEAKFLELRTFMPERSSVEDYEMIRKKLPPKTQEMLIKEAIKRREKRPWVRVTFPPSLSADYVLVAVQHHLQEQLPEYKEFATGFLFETATKNQQERFLALHRAQLDGMELHASPHDYQMSAEDVFQFISKKLRDQQELKAVIGPAMASSTKPAVAVHAFGEGDVSQQVVQFTRGADKGQNRGSGSNTSGKTFFPKSAGERSGSPKSQFQPKPVNTSVCDMCRRAGRVHMHDFRECAFFKKAIDEMVKKNPEAAKQLCRTCSRDKLPANHDYRTCRKVWSSSGPFLQSVLGKQPGAAPQHKAE